MKLTRLLFFIIMIFAFISCNKNNNTPNPSNQSLSSNFYFEADLNGIKWKATKNLVANKNGTTDRFYLSGKLDNGYNFGDKSYIDEQISLYFGYNNGNPIGTCSLGIANQVGSGSYLITPTIGPIKSYSTFPPNYTGNLTITSYNSTEISGTFSFNAINQTDKTIIYLTNGKFKLPVNN